MTHEENNIGGRAELPGSDEQKVSRLLSNLKRVEAPKHFDLHLKARIARERPAETSRASLFPILKYALPLALFLVVGAGVMLKTSFDRGLDKSAVTQPVSPEPLSAPPQNIPQVAKNTESTGDPSNTAVAVSSPPVRPDEKGSVPNESPRRPRSQVEKPGGGSREMGGGNNTVDPNLHLKEFDVTNSNTQKIANSASTATADSVRDALRTMGVDVELDGNTWAVKNVGAGSIGGSMGLKPGDRVEAIDGKPVDRNTTFKGVFKASVFTVRRDGKVIELKP